MRGLSVVITLGAALATTPALAEPPSEQVSETTFHQGQFGLSARLVLGYHALATNSNMTYCGVTDSGAAYGYASACTERAPIMVDIEAAYGVARSIEVLVDLSIGIEKEFASTPTANDGPRPLRLEPGARFFFAEAAHMKMFAQPMTVFDFTGYANKSWDFGVRAIEGVWIDLHRTYGIYFFVGETVELYRWLQAPPPPASRWLEAGFEGGIGFQGRYP